MLDNVLPREQLLSLARKKRPEYVVSTFPNQETDSALEQGWTVRKKLRRSTQFSRPKTHDVLLEDRVWCLLHRMGFGLLSGDGGAILGIDDETLQGSPRQIDVVAIDDEVAIAVECKSAVSPRKKPRFAEELGKHNLLRSRFAQAVRSQFTCETKRAPVLAMFTANIILTDSDRKTAEEAAVVLFDEVDLKYYEQLVAHLGPAARYQFLSDLMPGRSVEGLRIRVPAIRSKMFGVSCYTFSISPDYLLKIAFVSHRAKGHASDVDKYQRMVAKGRLSNIRDYITEGGAFPTNIILNLDASSHVQFERTKQEADLDGVTLGWLDLKPAYKSAWIIDGQHRLFAYSGHPSAQTSAVSVLAFEGLQPSTQAKLFIDINAKQKSVKQSLLEELYGELHWDAEDPRVRVRAIVSKAVSELGSSPDSPFLGRIQHADDGKSDTRCITFDAIFKALSKAGFYIAKERHGHVVDYGPLWAGDNRATLNRTVTILKEWFGTIRQGSLDWWELGRAKEGGGLAMNDPVTACINVLRSVFEHLEKSGRRLVSEDDSSIAAAILPYAEAVGGYLGSLSPEKRREFRILTGSTGHIARTRWCQKAIHDKFDDFEPDGLAKWFEDQNAENNRTADELINKIEKTIQSIVIGTLKSRIGPAESQWWMEGVPEPIRLDARRIWELDKGKRGTPEHYLNLIHYRPIALKNWEYLQDTLAYGKGGKNARTEWMVSVNDLRNELKHASSLQSVSSDQVALLREYDEWLSGEPGAEE